MTGIEELVRREFHRIDELPVPVALPDPEAINALALNRGRRERGWWPVAVAASIVLVVAVGVVGWWLRPLDSLPAAPAPASTSPTADTPTGAADLASALVGPTWEVETIRGVPVVARGRKPHLFFDRHGEVSGSNGCNGFGGAYLADGSTLTFSGLTVTFKLCPAGEETALVEVIEQTAAAQIDGSMLTLFDGDGTALATFTATTPR